MKKAMLKIGKLLFWATVLEFEVIGGIYCISEIKDILDE